MQWKTILAYEYYSLTPCENGFEEIKGSEFFKALESVRAGGKNE